jgi:HK97 family phage prohead protease
VNKTVIAQIKGEGATSRRLTYTISTKDLDRDSDRILAWDLSNYRRNPVVLAFHDNRSLPVARTVAINQVGDSLIATAEFITADLSPFADQCFRMAAAGFMSGCSVGFAPAKGFPPVHNDFNGWDFPKAELYEWSVVPVPANSAALRRGVGAAKSAKSAGAQLTDKETIRVIVESVLRAEETEAAEMAAIIRAVDKHLTAREQKTFRRGAV